MWLSILLVSCGEPQNTKSTSPLPKDTGSTQLQTSPVSCGALSALPPFASYEEGRLFAQLPGHDLYVDSHGDGVVRLQYVRAGAAPDYRSFVVPERTPEAVSVGGSGGRAVLCAADLSVEISPAGQVVVRDSEGVALVEDGADGGFVDLGSSVGVRRYSPPEERFYGFGERTGGLQKRGRRLVLRNIDAYDSTWGAYRPDQDPLYLSIPFYQTLRDGRAAGVFIDTPYTGEVDIAASEANTLSFTTEGDRIDQYVIAGPSMPDVLRRYTDLVGKPAMPPLWALGYHQCRWGYWPDDRLYELADTFRALRLPADSLWLDIQHMDGYRTFTFDPAGFPDPAGLDAALAAEGFHTVVIADPGLKEDPGWPIWDEALSGDHLLKNPDGSPFIGTVWPGPSGFPDFSRPETRTFWADHVSDLASLGIDGIWLDVNEPTTFPEGGAGLSVDDSVLADGNGIPTTMAEVHGVYALLQSEATVDGLRMARPEGRPFVLSRAGYAGIASHAATWTGDVSSTFDGLSLTLPMMLGLGLSGVPFVGSDIGGYSGRAPDGTPTSPELFARWMALGAVSPLMRGHTTSGAIDSEPWAFGQEVQDISRIHLDWRYQLLPYLYSLFDEATRTGAPLLRPMIWDFAGDPRMLEVGDQAMLGPSLLVAPVLVQGATSRHVLLPEGRWYELSSGAIWEGPAEIDTTVTLQALPLFAREGAILPIAPRGRQHTGEPAQGPLFLDLYPSEQESRFVLYEDAGDGSAALRTTLSLVGTGTGATLTATREGDYDVGSRDLLVRFRRMDGGASAVYLDNTPLSPRASREELDLLGGFWFDADDRSLWARYPDPGAHTLSIEGDRTVTDLRPPVEIALSVTVPEGTPHDPPVHIASDANGWIHEPLSWDPNEPTRAYGTLTVPRGEWYLFKYTRGDWCTVEKYPDCEEALDRYAFGAADLDRQDVVYGWRDWCEVCP